ncbi:MAG: DNA repair protein RadA, partial [Clostridiales Family XIII bacterium]|nr:DNA repair protein RadA [Clostridiales Family XIII bacterium]
MPKRDTVFVCQECGYESPKWMGQCVCGAWNSFVEERVAPPGPPKGIGAAAEAGFMSGLASGLTSASGKAAAKRPGSGGAGFDRARGRAIALRDVNSASVGGRAATGISELDRVLGGGLVAGSLTLISGEPGIGKSTLILQAAARLAATKGAALYVSGEESEEQIRLRADRVTSMPPAPNTSNINAPVLFDSPSEREADSGGANLTPASGTHTGEASGASSSGGAIPENLYILSETNLGNIALTIGELKPVFLIIDSIQTMYTDYVESAAGSVSQIRACTNELMRLAKTTDIPVFIVAHVTKTGDLAGPKVIEHLVDCVLNFTGDRTQDIRILRAQKNRFGTTSEIGAFEMREEGLVEIQNLSGVLLEGMDGAAEGAVATAVYEGTRPLLLEIQALTAACGVGFPRRTAIGVELARLNMMIAVLERKAGIDLSSVDVYVNVVGGIKPDGTSIDLAVALAICSSAKGTPVPPRICALGEIGLTGELRSVRGADKMAAEAARLGFTKVI